MEVLIHSANVIYLVSYVMRDILWLRVFTVIAAACLILYFYFLPNPLLTPVYWNILFIILNVFWIARLFLERRPVHSHVWMWELDHQAEYQRTDAFELWCWRRLLRVPCTTRISNQSILKKINPEYSLEGLMLKLKFQYFATWWEEPTHWKKSWC